MSLLVLSPVMATVRIVYPRWLNVNTGVPEELYQESTREKLKSFTNKDELCLVFPDQSNCIFFYYLDRKGINYSQTNLFFSKSYGIQIAKKCVISTIYFYNENNISNLDSVFNQKCVVEDSVGKFYILRWR